MKGQHWGQPLKYKIAKPGVPNIWERHLVFVFPVHPGWPLVLTDIGTLTICSAKAARACRSPRASRIRGGACGWAGSRRSRRGRRVANAWCRMPGFPSLCPFFLPVGLRPCCFCPDRLGRPGRPGGDRRWSLYLAGVTSVKGKTVSRGEWCWLDVFAFVRALARLRAVLDGLSRDIARYWWSEDGIGMRLSGVKRRFGCLAKRFGGLFAGFWRDLEGRLGLCWVFGGWF